MKWEIQHLGHRPGYPHWNQYAIRDIATNVCIAIVGDVDRYFEKNTLEHATLMHAAPELLEALEMVDRIWSNDSQLQPDSPLAIVRNAIAQAKVKA